MTKTNDSFIVSGTQIIKRFYRQKFFPEISIISLGQGLRSYQKSNQEFLISQKTKKQINNFLACENAAL